MMITYHQTRRGERDVFPFRSSPAVTREGLDGTVAVRDVEGSCLRMAVDTC